MKCVICKQAETVSGTATVTLERGEFTYVVKGVPAQVCPNCGEDYVSEQITSEFLPTLTAEKIILS
jgi:YgiT-type zinc finger domain-containing protein